jgi:hypothetical protein
VSSSPSNTANFALKNRFARKQQKESRRRRANYFTFFGEHSFFFLLDTTPHSLQR